MFGSDQYVRAQTRKNPRESLSNICVSRLKIAGVSFLQNHGKITLEGKHFFDNKLSLSVGYF